MDKIRAKNILFVCTGNVCRSPMAEYLLRHHLRGKDAFAIRSAGLFAASGQPASPAAIEVMNEMDIDMTPHRSRMLSKELVDAADWIMVMTHAQASETRLRYPPAAGKVRLLNEFGGVYPVRDISDPIGCSPATYRVIRDEINSALLDLILLLRKGSK